MSFWQNFSIRSKVLAAFAAVFLVTLCLGLFGLSRTGAVNNEAMAIRNDFLPSTIALGQLVSAVKETRIKEARVIISAMDGGVPVDSDVKAFQTAQSAGDKAYADYLPLADETTDDAPLMKAFAADWAKYKQSSAAVMDKLAKKDFDTMLSLYEGDDRTNYYDAVGKADADAALNATEGKKAADRGAAVYDSSRLLTFGSIFLAALLCTSAGWAIIVSIAGPIRATTTAVDRLAAGDFRVAVTGIERKDEIGVLARSLNVFKDNMKEAERLRAEQAAEQKHQLDRARRIESSVASFEKTVGDALAVVSTSAAELEMTANAMRTTAEETSRQSGTVAAASEEATTNVQTVASATEELSSSIKEITQQVGESTRIVGESARQAADTNTRVQRLKELVEKIDTVVSLINDIASQTNLLALNATIEAARAGEAGKGFAVVASEVKALATQTAKATEEITAQISGIQAETDQSVQSIEAITHTIGKVNDIATSIAAAVEEQGSATQEIARSVAQAAQGTTEVSATIVGVSEASKQTGAAAAQVLSAAKELSANRTRLSDEVARFLKDVRAA